MTRTRRLVAFVLALALCVGLMVPAMAADVGTQYEKTAGYVAKTVASPGFGSIGGDWAVLGLARGGADVKSGYFEGYYERLESYVKSCEGVLHKRKYTEYSRVALAVTAIGKDARDVAGYNLLLPLGDYEKTVYQGVNGAIFALLALDAGQYEVPVNTDAKTQATRELYVQKILDSQLSDGGWNIAGTAADADLTAMALQALAGYTAQASVKTAIDKGVAALFKIQGADGGFSTGGAATCESNAQVLVALAELGISLDDSRFVKIVRQIEELYRKDAEQQIQAVQNNALLDYRELKWLQQEYARLTDLNNNQTEQMQTFLDQLAEPSVRERIFSIADALIGGQPVAVLSGGGGGNADSDLRWDGRRPDEEEEAYRRRCLMFAIGMINRQKSYKRK